MNLYDRCMIFFSYLLKKYSRVFVRKEKEIERLAQNKKPTLIIFWHPTCYDCERLFLRFIQIYFLSKRHKYTLKFCDIKENEWLKKKYHIDVVPTMIHFQEGKEKGKYLHFKEIYNALKKIKK